MFSKQLAALVSVAIVAVWFAQSAHALGGNLKTPGISIPLDRPDGGENIIAAKINQTLGNHQAEFVNGSFVNSNSSMNFRGNTEKLNSFLKDLSEIEGSKVTIKFSNDKGVGHFVFPEAGNPDQACQWSVFHNGWSQPHGITMTIYLGDGLIQLDQLNLPSIRGIQQNAEVIEHSKEPKATE